MISLNNITKKYKDKTVLKNINLEIKQEKGIASLIGPNGAGKSTIMRLMSGILLPTSGTIEILRCGENIIKNDYDLRKEVTFIPTSERVLYFKLSVKENIVFYNILRGMSKKDVLEKYESVIEDIGFRDFENRLVESLSTGEKRKALLACALCSNCRIIVLDEPTTGLDNDAKANFKSILLNNSVSQDKLFVISSHDFDLLSGLSEENIFIFDGEISATVNGKITNEELIQVYSNKKIQ